jgi:hypothetical protein
MRKYNQFTQTSESNVGIISQCFKSGHKEASILLKQMKIRKEMDAMKKDQRELIELGK